MSYFVISLVSNIKTDTKDTQKLYFKNKRLAFHLCQLKHSIAKSIYRPQIILEAQVLKAGGRKRSHNGCNQAGRQEQLGMSWQGPLIELDENQVGSKGRFSRECQKKAS